MFKKQWKMCCKILSSYSETMDRSREKVFQETSAGPKHWCLCWCRVDVTAGIAQLLHTEEGGDKHILFCPQF